MTDQEIRAAALEAASRAIEPGYGAPGVILMAKQFEDYIRNGKR